MSPESPAPCGCGHLLGMMHFMSYSQEWPWGLLFFPSRFARSWLWKFILLEERTPVLVGLIVSPPLSSPIPRTGCYSFGSAENAVRFCSSTIQKIELNALCTFRFQILPCQLLFFNFWDFFASLFLFSLCLFYSILFIEAVFFWHLISFCCILLILWFSQLFWDSKNLETTFGLNKKGRKQKWWRQIWQTEEILANTKKHWKILRQYTKNMTEWWWYLSENPLGAKSACTEIDSAPVETGTDPFQPYHRKFIGDLVENCIVTILSAVLIMD